MNQLLYPDKNLMLLKKYHLSNKLILPTFLSTFVLNYNFNENKLDNRNKNILLVKLNNICTSYNLCYHSYFSLSTIITDYHRKIPFINEKLLRFGNLKINSFIFLYSLYSLYSINLSK